MIGSSPLRSIALRAAERLALGIWPVAPPVANVLFSTLGDSIASILVMEGVPETEVTHLRSEEVRLFVEYFEPEYCMDCSEFMPRFYGDGHRNWHDDMSEVLLGPDSGPWTREEDPNILTVEEALAEDATYEEEAPSTVRSSQDPPPPSCFTAGRRRNARLAEVMAARELAARAAHAIDEAPVSAWPTPPASVKYDDVDISPETLRSLWMEGN